MPCRGLLLWSIVHQIQEIRSVKKRYCEINLFLYNAQKIRIQQQQQTSLILLRVPRAVADLTLALVRIFLDVVEAGRRGHIGQPRAGQGRCPCPLHRHGDELTAGQERGFGNVIDFGLAIRGNLPTSTAVLGRAVGSVLPGDLALDRFCWHDVEKRE